MKGMLIYNPYSNAEKEFIAKVKEELGVAIVMLSVWDIPDVLKYFVRATPALIMASDDLQGEHLLGNGADGQLIVTGMLCKCMEEEDLAIHHKDTYRMDNLINAKIFKAIDEYTLELFEGGLI